jgi:predicted HTH transcriptional regulator
VREKTSEVREKRLGSDGENLGSEDANSDFEVLMGAYRNDFRENARKILSAIAGDQEIDTTGLTQKLGISEASVWRAIRAMKEVGLLVREGGDKGGKWIVKK